MMGKFKNMRNSRPAVLLPTVADDAPFIDLSSEDSNDNSSISPTQQRQGSPVNVHTVDDESTSEGGNQQQPFNEQLVTNGGKKRKLKEEETTDDNNDVPKKVQKKIKKITDTSYSDLTLDDFCCSRQVKDQILEYLCDFKYNAAQRLCVDLVPLGGLLIYGPMGCGKHTLVKGIAGEMKLPILTVKSSQFICEVEKSERRIRFIFNKAATLAPCLLFIENLDRCFFDSKSTEFSIHVVDQLMSSITELFTSNSRVLLVASARDIEKVNVELRHRLRFSDEVALGIPNVSTRKDILKRMTKGYNLAEDFDFDLISHALPGYTGYDILNLIHEAKKSFVKSNSTLKEIKDNKVYLTNEHFLKAKRVVVPSVKSQGFAFIPEVTWDDVGALTSIRQELRIQMINAVEYPDLLEPNGILLYGPPGCGKTLVAKAVANEAGLNFLAVNGPEIFNMYVGESERLVRLVFQRARAAAPCVIFFDEFDSICPRRASGEEGGVQSRVVNQLLIEMDGVRGDRAGVFLLGATNRLDKIDPAIIRSRRFSRKIYIGLPSIDDRESILKTIIEGREDKFTFDVDVKAIVGLENCENMTGADLKELVEETIRHVLEIKRSTNSEEICTITDEHFKHSLSRVQKSISSEDIKFYESQRNLHPDLLENKTE